MTDKLNTSKPELLLKSVLTEAAHPLIDDIVLNYLAIDMITKDSFFEMALSFPGTEQKPHFDRTAFKVTGKRIFTTYHAATHSANMLLSLKEQKTFSAYEGGAIHPVSNKWGLQGWTTFELNNLDEGLVLNALSSAYELVRNTKKQ